MNTNPQTLQPVPPTPCPQPPADIDTTQAAHHTELRRQMYERIAAGNAINEAERQAERRWRR